MNTSMQNMLSELEAAKLLLLKYGNLSEIPNIERDIALSKLRLVYDILLSESSIPSIKEIVSQQIIDKPLITKTKEVSDTKIESVESKAENHVAPVSEIITEDILTLEDEKTQHKVIETLKELVIPNITKEPESPVEKTIIAEKYHKNQTYINELLAQGLQKKDISSLMQSKPVRDIEAAIGVNERFIFIKELFSGDGETYIKTIRLLNSAANFNEAFNYIRQTYSWNLDGEAAQKLLEIVRRRFIVDVE
jgi:hypothetical protein